MFKSVFDKITNGVILFLFPFILTIYSLEKSFEILGIIIPTYQIINARNNELSDLLDEECQSVLIYNNDNWELGIEIERISEEFATVYLPNLPDCKTGKLKLIPISKVKVTKIPIKETLKIFKKYGRGIQL